MTWERLLTEFAIYQKAKGLQPTTIESRAYTLRALARHTGVEPEQITLTHLRERLARGLSKGSIQTESDTYRAFFAFLVDEGHRDDNPCDRLPRVRAPRGRPRPYTQEQVDQLLSSGAYRRTRIMIMLAYHQGLRAAEIARVHGRDIDTDTGTLKVTGKGGKVAFLPLHPAVAEIAATMPRDGYWFPARGERTGHIRPRSVYDLMTRAKKRSGIRESKLSGHSLRHAYGTELVRAGVDLRTVQELMRHESLATTQIYTLITDEQMRAAITQLPAHTLPAQSGRSIAA